MLLNIRNNGKILKDNLDIKINDFTILTDKNGSGKTQLLEFIRDYHNGQPLMGMVDVVGNDNSAIYPLIDDNGKPLTEIAFSYPGLKNVEQVFYHPQNDIYEQIKNQWETLAPITNVYHALRLQLLMMKLLK